MSTLKVAAINNPSAPSGGLAISTAGNVTGAGLDLITSQSFTAASTVSVNNCFTSAYDNYRIVARYTGTVAGQTNLRFRTAASDYTGATYKWRNREGVFSSTTGSDGAGNDLTTGRFGYWAALEASTVMDVLSPALSQLTHTHSQHQYGDGYGVQGSLVNVTNTFDGFTIYPTSGTITGTLRVYGYRN